MQTISRTTLNEAGDIIRHDALGDGDWMVVEAAMAGAGKSYCNSYPDAWKLSLRHLTSDGSIDWSVPRIVRYQDTTAFPSNMVLPYVEPVRRNRLALGLMPRHELVAYLRWMALEIEQGARIEGSLNCDRLSSEEYSVSAAVRYRDENGVDVTDFIGQRYVPEKKPEARRKPAA